MWTPLRKSLVQAFNTSSNVCSGMRPGSLIWSP